MSPLPLLGRRHAEREGPRKIPAEPPTGRRGRGLARSIYLFRLFLREQTDPDSFYRSLARDAVRQVEDYCDIRGRTVVDVGGGAGQFTAAFRAGGAACFLFEPDRAEL